MSAAERHGRTLLDLAEGDWQAARAMSDDRLHVSDRIIGFHLQQSAEKAVKAWINHLGVTYSLTHDLQGLLDQLARAGADVTTWRDLVDLTPYAVEFRYGVPDMPALDRDRWVRRVEELLVEVGKLVGR